MAELLELEPLVEKLDIKLIPIKDKISQEVKRYKKFQQIILGTKTPIVVQDIDIRNYAKFILQEGSDVEKREFLNCLEGNITLKNKEVSIL